MCFRAASCRRLRLRLAPATRRAKRATCFFCNPTAATLSASCAGAPFPARDLHDLIGRLTCTFGGQIVVGGAGGAEPTKRVSPSSCTGRCRATRTDKARRISLSAAGAALIRNDSAPSYRPSCRSAETLIGLDRRGERRNCRAPIEWRRRAPGAPFKLWARRRRAAKSRPL